MVPLDYSYAARDSECRQDGRRRVSVLASPALRLLYRDQRSTEQIRNVGLGSVNVLVTCLGVALSFTFQLGRGRLVDITVCGQLRKCGRGAESGSGPEKSTETS